VFRDPSRCLGRSAKRPTNGSGGLYAAAMLPSGGRRCVRTITTVRARPGRSGCDGSLRRAVLRAPAGAQRNGHPSGPRIQMRCTHQRPLAPPARGRGNAARRLRCVCGGERVARHSSQWTSSGNPFRPVASPRNGHPKPRLPWRVRCKSRASSPRCRSWPTRFRLCLPGRQPTSSEHCREGPQFRVLGRGLVMGKQ